MSKGNIISIELVSGDSPVPVGEVTFQTSRGIRVYSYVGPAAVAILGGDDPRTTQEYGLCRVPNRDSGQPETSLR
jgi:hypothetical protein